MVHKKLDQREEEYMNFSKNEDDTKKEPFLRHLQGTYLNIDEVLSKYCVLRKQFLSHTYDKFQEDPYNNNNGNQNTRTLEPIYRRWWGNGSW